MKERKSKAEGQKERKLQTSVFLRNIEAKILSKVEQIVFNNSTIHKLIIQHNHTGLIPGIQGLFNIENQTVYQINRLQKKNHMTILMNIEKAFKKLLRENIWDLWLDREFRVVTKSTIYKREN